MKSLGHLRAMGKCRLKRRKMKKEPRITAEYCPNGQRKKKIHFMQGREKRKYATLEGLLNDQTC
jgi:hypothetical protein